MTALVWSLGLETKQLRSVMQALCLCDWPQIKILAPRPRWVSLIGNASHMLSYFCVRRIKLHMQLLWEKKLEAVQGFISCAFPFLEFYLYPFSIINFNHEYYSFSEFSLFFFFLILGFELRALCLLGKCSTWPIHASSPFCFVFQVGFCFCPGPALGHNPFTARCVLPTTPSLFFEIGFHYLFCCCYAICFLVF
jgi:hypothetical protein